MAPTHNRECQRAVARYARKRASPNPAEASFEAIALERVVAALAEAGAEETAARLTKRCLDFGPVLACLEESPTGRPRRGVARSGCGVPESRLA